MSILRNPGKYKIINLPAATLRSPSTLYVHLSPLKLFPSSFRAAQKRKRVEGQLIES